MNELRLEIVFANALQIAAAPKGRAFVKIIFDRFALTVEGNHVMYTLPVDHTVLMQVSYVDAKGNPAEIDGDVTWTSSADEIATVTVDGSDSALCRVTPVALGQVQIIAKCDADLGEGVRELLTTGDVEIVAGEAVAGVITPVGAPEPI